MLDQLVKNVISQASLTAHLQQLDGEINYGNNWRDVRRFEFRPSLDNDGSPAWKLKDDRYYSIEAAVAYILDDMAERVYLALEEDIKKW